MGYELEYNEQSRVLRNMECNLSDIEDELKMLVTLADTINQVWTSDAGEKYYIIMAIQQVRKSLGKDIGCLRTFALSAKGYLKQMQEFEKYTPKVVKGTCSVTNINALKSKKTKVICDLTRLQEVQGKLNSCARRIKRLSNTVNTNVAQVDGTMANVVSGGKSVLKKYVNDITHQAGQVEKIGKVIVQIKENYKKAEDNIKKITDKLKNETITEKTLEIIISETQKIEKERIIDILEKRDRGKEWIEQVWEELKNIKNGVSITSEMTDFISFIVNSDSVDTFEKIKEMSLFKGVKHLDDMEKIYDMYNAKDYVGITEFFGKKVLRQVYKAKGVEGFEVTGYVTMSWNFLENSVSGIQKYGNDPNVFRGMTKYLWHITGWTLIESGTEIAYEDMSSVAGIVGIDLDKIYGGEGIDGFYKQADELKNIILDQGFNGWCSGMKLIGDSIEKRVNKTTIKLVRGVKGIFTN